MPLRVSFLDEDGVFRQSHRGGRRFRREKIRGYVRTRTHRRTGVEGRQKEKPRRFRLRHKGERTSVSRETTSAQAGYADLAAATKIELTRDGRKAA